MEIRGGPPGGAPASDVATLKAHEVALLAIALICLLAAAVGYFGGSTKFSKTLSPSRESGRSVYTAGPVHLDPGRYNFTLSMRVKIRTSGLNLMGTRRTFTVTSPQRAGWSESETLSWKPSRSDRKKRRSGSRTRTKTSSSTFVLAINTKNAYTFSVAADANVPESLTFKVKTALFDYRLPLALGLALIVIVCILSDSLRSAVLSRTRR